MKKLTLFIYLLFFCSLFGHAQNGLENIIVEKYYISNAADSIGSVANGGGSLPVGSVTYRLYVDMLPGYKFQAAYGTNTPGAAHELRLATTTTFFNNEDRGSSFPNFTKAQASTNTVMLDSWLSVGGACDTLYGILKSDDNGVLNAVNADGLLLNADPAAGIPLTTQDGFFIGSPLPQSVTLVGITNPIAVFNNTQNGNLFSTNNGSWSSLNGSTGATTANKVLIGQFTTNGCFSYELNIQIGTPTGGVQNYVARNPVGNEIMLSSLRYNVADVSISASPAGTICPGTMVNFTATPVNGGSAPIYDWKKNGVSIGAPNSATYSTSTLLSGDVITCTLTSDSACVNSVTSNSIAVTVLPTAAASVSITSNKSGPSCVGSNTTFTASPINSGSSPSFQWLKNNVNVGANSTIYTASALVNGDQVKCIMTSSYQCVTGSPATSNTLTTTTISSQPTISNFSPLTGTVGTVITINGSGFTGVTSVKINTTSATFVVVNSNQITATVPSGATTGKITVANDCGTVISTATYTVNGLEGIIVEKYYISNAADSITSVAEGGGALPVGSTTYRLYVDMLPGYKFQAAYGTNTPGAAHELRIATTTTFFNNEDRGATFPTWTKAQAANNTVMLDSWLSAGAACDTLFGILKSEDNGLLNVVNADGILQNNDPAAGIPLTSQDGFIIGSPKPQSVTLVGVTNPIAVFNNTQNGNLFSTNNGSWSSLNGSTGPTTANKVLIGQFTTDGCFSYELNIQIGTPSGGVQNFVARNPVGSEIQIPGLFFNAADVSIAANPAGTICPGTNVTFTATATNAGSSPVYDWKKNGVSIGAPNSATYSTSTLVSGDVITCALTSDAVCSATVTSNALATTVLPFAAASVSISSNKTGPSCLGSTTIFTASPLNSGSSPSFQWLKNGGNVGTSSPTYSASALVNGDSVKCIMTSNYQCVTGSPATSNTLVTTTISTQPTVSSIAPLSGTTGTVVTINGTNFVGITSVKFNNTSASFTLINSGQITATVPTGATTGKITVFNDCGTAISFDNFVVIGIENIIVEKYYISNAADSIGSVANGGGALPVGSTTYRLYVDMLPGYKFQAAYGTNTPGGEHELRIATTTKFFNNEDRGSTFPSFTKAQAANNSVMLDSWLSVGAACDTLFGILKSEDNATANVVNLDGILLNADTAAGIPLTSRDGFFVTLPKPQSVTLVGITSPIPVFNNTQNGNLFSTNNGSWASLNGSSGPTTANKVLIGQFTTDGCFSFELNIQVGTPSGGIQNFVARNPIGGELQLPGLIFNVADVTIAASPAGIICPGTSVTFTTSAKNAGSSPVYNWKKNGISIGAPNSATYTTSSLINGDIITCDLTSDAVCSATVTSNAITTTVLQNVTPSLTIVTAPLCSGSNATFTAIPVNSGTNPTFQWIYNGSVVAGVDSVIYTTSTPPNINDSVRCIMTSNYQCTTGNPATSNKITITSFLPFLTPTVNITSNNAGPVCFGTKVTFTASQTNGFANAPANTGTAPSYQWYKNSFVTTTSSATFVDSVLTTDTIKCVMTSRYACTSANPVTSNSIIIDGSYCAGTINLRTFIEGFYIGGETMQAVLDPFTYPTICDSIIVELADSATLQIVASKINVIDINGYGSFNFTGLQPSTRYYFVIRLRNSIETWSKNTYLFNSPNITFDLTRL